MKNEKKHPRKQLEKYSNIFMQLSLVLVLFVVYQLIEHETRYNSLAIDVPESSIDYILKVDETPVVQFKKEVNAIIKKMPKFTPGMQRKVPVNVKFTLPISFNVK